MQVYIHLKILKWLSQDILFYVIILYVMFFQYFLITSTRVLSWEEIDLSDNNNFVKPYFKIFSSYFYLFSSQLNSNDIRDCVSKL